MSDADDLEPQIRQLEERITTLERQRTRLQRAVVELLYHYNSQRPFDSPFEPAELSELGGLDEIVVDESALGKTLASVLNGEGGRGLQTRSVDSRGTSSRATREDDGQAPDDGRAPTDDGYQI